MKKLRVIACILLLGLVIPGVIHLYGHLPADPQPLIEKKYGGWAGVLRLWIFEGWQPGAGSAAGWLNRCIASFEKLHPGVYIQPEYVDASTMRALGSDGLLPPDLALFPPGLLTSTQGLLPLEAAPSLRPGLQRSDCAVPVMLGGYMWAFNTALLERLPVSWREAEVIPAALPDEDWRHWETALLALCSGLAVQEAPEAQSETTGEMDLGLNEAEVHSTPEPQLAGEPLRCLLPERFAPDESAWQSFVNGEVAAMPVTQREVRRLQALSDQGRGPDWQLAASGNPFTDQVLYLSIPDHPAPEDKRALCQAFVAHLLDDGCQGELRRAGAFAVTNAASGYPANDPLAGMDALLRQAGLCVPAPFDTGWTEYAESYVRKFLSGDPDPAGLWREFSGHMLQISEH